MKTRLIRMILCLSLAVLMLAQVPAALAAEQVSISDGAAAKVLRSDGEDLNAPVLTFNMGDHDYINWNRWTDPARSALMYDAASKTYTRVEYIGSEVTVETYDAGYNFVSRKSVAVELPLYGGFHCGDTCNFLIFGQENPNEDDTLEVIRVVKYDKNWNRLGQASLCGANTTIPFDAGTVSTAEYGGYLYIRTSHEMYQSSDGYNHQSNLTMNVRISDMEITDSFYDVMNSKYGYISHSFNQFIQVDESNAALVAVDHGDANPRSVVLTRYNAPAGQDSFMVSKKVSLGGGYYTWSYAETVDLLAIMGSKGANDTGVSVGGFEISDSSYLVAGTTVDQSESSYNAFGQRNVFLTVTDKSALTTNVLYLTSYTSDQSVDLANPQLVKLDGNKFLVLWASYGSDAKQHYVFVDGKGNLLTEIYSVSTPNCESCLSDCQPIVVDGKVVWYMTASSKPVFFTIDPNNPGVFTENHLWDYTIASYPTDDAEGKMTGVCYICQEEVSFTMPALSSDEYTVSDSSEAGCESKGQATFIWCTPYGDWLSFTATTAALGHNWSEWEPADGKVNCGGYTDYTRTCSRCSKTETDTRYTSHSYELDIIPPTCTEQGYTNQVCSNCGDTRFLNGSYTSPTGHDWSGWTCLEDNSCVSEGLWERSCTVCKEKETTKEGYGDHNYKVTEKLEAGCLVDGYEIYTCSVCGDSYKTEYPGSALGHWWETEVQEEGTLWTCTRCGYSKMEYFDGDEEVIEPGEEPTPVEPDEPDEPETPVEPDEPDTPAEPVNPFKDVAENDYFYSPVLWAVGEGITNGYGADDIFNPGGVCTRGQVVTFLWRSMGQPEPETTENPFKDVTEKDYFYKAVLWAVEQGITNGYGAEDIFNPDGNCTRGQVATFLWRSQGEPKPELTENPFGDVAQKDYFYYPVLWALENEITTGLTADTFGPDDDCTRGQIVTFLYRALAE